MLKRLLPVVAACLFIHGCASGQNRTLIPSIHFDMTQEQVLANLEPTQKVVHRDAGTIVTEGYDSHPWKMNRRNEFIFHNGRLTHHNNSPMPEQD